jgi:hypothetical protein
MTYLRSQIARCLQVFGLVSMFLSLSAATNANPCTEPWTVTLQPVVGLTLNGIAPFQVCPDQPATFDAGPYVFMGTKQRCDQTASFGVTNQQITWAITGPAGFATQTGSGQLADLQVFIANNPPGAYVVTWTITATWDDPDVSGTSSGTFTWPFTIPSVTPTVTIGSATACPGNQVNIGFTINNPSTCPLTFSYSITALPAAGGGPTVVFQAPTSGAPTIAGPGNFPGSIMASIDPHSAPGVYNYQISAVLVSSSGAPAVATGTITVVATQWQCSPSPTIQVSGTQSATQLCADGAVTFNANASTTPGTANLVCPASGAVVDTHQVTVSNLTYTWSSAQGIAITANGAMATAAFSRSQPGQYVVTVTVSGTSSDSNCPVASASYDFNVQVTAPQGTIKFDDTSCPVYNVETPQGGETNVEVTYTITNTGTCADTFDWLITCDSKDIKVFRGVMQSTKLFQPGESKQYGFSFTLGKYTPPGTVNFLAVLQCQGTELNRDHACIKVANCEPEEPKTVSADWDFDKVPGVNEFKVGLDKLEEVLKQAPGITIEPSQPKLTGSFSMSIGKECCPGALEASRFIDYSGTGTLSCGIGLQAKYGWEKSFDYDFLNRNISGDAFVGIIASVDLTGSGKLTVSGHQGNCNHCVTVGGSVGLSGEGKVKGGGELKLTYTDPTGKKTDIKVGAVVSGSIEGGCGLSGAVHVGEQCPDPNTLQFCSGPISSSASVEVDLTSYFSISGTVDFPIIVGSHCTPLL